MLSMCRNRFIKQTSSLTKEQEFNFSNISFSGRLIISVSFRSSLGELLGHVTLATSAETAPPASCYYCNLSWPRNWPKRKCTYKYAHICTCIQYKYVYVYDCLCIYAYDLITYDVYCIIVHTKIDCILYIYIKLYHIIFVLLHL